MVVFAASLLGVVGTFNVIDGIAAVTRSHVFIASAHYVVLLLTMSAATTPVTCPARPRANPVQAPH
jgi:hypothetical protein